MHTKTHQIAPLKKRKFRGGGMPPNPPSKAHGIAMRSMSLRDMQNSKYEKYFLALTPPKSWLRTCTKIPTQKKINFTNFVKIKQQGT